jgi:hypothetical protein
VDEGGRRTTVVPRIPMEHFYLFVWWNVWKICPCGANPFLRGT